MPQPRNAEHRPSDLETLPPVSEDELEAIKARLAAPGRADRPADPDLAAVDTEERVADRKSSWLFPILIGAAGLGAAAFWLFNRRKPQH